MDLTTAIRLICADLRTQPHLDGLDDAELIDHAVAHIGDDEIDGAHADGETAAAYAALWDADPPVVVALLDT